MKKYLYILLVALFFISCDVDSFLDEKPTGIVIPETVEHFDGLLEEPDDGWNWINLICLDPDVYLNDMVFNLQGKESYRNQYKWAADYHGINVDLDYQTRYEVLYVSNLILENIDDAELGDRFETDRKIIKGEAYAQRAMNLFILVNEYAPHYDPQNDTPGVAMPLKTDLAAQLSKSSVHDVYSQIESDLEKAEELFKNYIAANTKANFRPGKASIKGLLALVNLYKGNFELAATYATSALELYDFVYDFTEFSLDDDGDATTWDKILYDGSEFKDFYFSNDTKSVIWNRGGPANLSNDINPSNLLFNPDLEVLFDKANDQRWILNSSSVSVQGVDVSPNFACSRERDQVNVGVTVPNLLLVKAEALARSEKGAEAIEILNSLLVKRINGFTDLTHVDDATTLQTIKNERRKELMFTGSNVIDLKRYHVLGESVPTFTRTVNGNTYSLEPGSSRYYAPIPKIVSNANSNL